VQSFSVAGLQRVLVAPESARGFGTVSHPGKGTLSFLSHSFAPREKMTRFLFAFAFLALVSALDPRSEAGSLRVLARQLDEQPIDYCGTCSYESAFIVDSCGPLADKIPEEWCSDDQGQYCCATSGVCCQINEGDAKKVVRGILAVYITVVLAIIASIVVCSCACCSCCPLYDKMCCNGNSNRPVQATFPPPQNGMITVPIATPQEQPQQEAGKV